MKWASSYYSPHWLCSDCLHFCLDFSDLLNSLSACGLSCSFDMFPKLVRVCFSKIHIWCIISHWSLLQEPPTPNEESLSSFGGLPSTYDRALCLTFWFHVSSLHTWSFPSRLLAVARIWHSFVPGNVYFLCMPLFTLVHRPVTFYPFSLAYYYR